MGKHRSFDNRRGGQPPPVSLTGAQSGDLLRGTAPGWNTGTLLQVVSGVVNISGSDAELNDVNEVVAATATHWNLTESAVRKLRTEIPSDKIPAPVCIGQTCTHLMQQLLDKCPKEKCLTSCQFRILSVGPKTLECAREAEKEEELLDILRTQRPVHYWEVVPLLGNHTFVLSRTRFAVSVGYKRSPPTAADTHDGAVIDLTQVGEVKDCAVVVDESLQLLLVLPPTRTAPIDAHTLSMMVLRDVLISSGDCVSVPDAISVLEGQLEKALTFLKNLTPGMLRSALQKAIRLRCREIHLDGTQPETNPSIIPVEVYVAAVASLLAVHPGSFVPDLQLYVRGDVSMFKRVAVSAVEDGMPDDFIPDQLLAAALACQRLTDWKPSVPLMCTGIKTAVMAARTSWVYDWRALLPSVQKKRTRKDVPAAEISRLSPIEGQHTRWHVAYALLCTLRSFPSDEAMFGAIATQIARGAVPKNDLQGLAAATVSASRMVDQHAWRGIAHLLPPETGTTIAARFAWLFTNVTGKNPRRTAVTVKEDEQTTMAHVQAAQRFSLDVARGVFAGTLKTEPENFEESVQVPQTMHAGVLAAAVGPIEVKPDTHGKRIVTLGVQRAEDEAVIWAPSRHAKKSLTEMTPLQSENAIQAVRSKSLHAKSPLLNSTKVVYDATLHSWTLDGVPWAQYLQQLPPISVPCLASTPLTFPPRHELGISANYKEEIQSVLTQFSSKAILRAMAVMQQQYKVVAFPQPSLQGRPSTESGGSGNVAGLVAHDMDLPAYALLLQIAHVAPAALTPVAPPTFKVRNPFLLRQVEQLIASALTTRSAATSALTQSSEASEWAFQPTERQLMQHQLDACAKMREREAAGQKAHFLVLPTGQGKTATTVEYLKELDRTQRLPRFVLWTIPKHSREEIVRELIKCGVSTCILDVTSRRVPSLRPFHVNVISDDHLRHILETLLDLVDQMVLVVDECDRCYAATQRSSAAHSLATLAWRVVCQTATPLRNSNCEQLAAWLRKTVRYPLDQDNWLVAANEMIHLQINLGIEKQYHNVPFDPAEDWKLEHQRKLLGDGDWLQLAKDAWNISDLHLVEAAEKRRKEGVLLVARDEDHRARLLQLLQKRGRATAGDSSSGPPPTRGTPTQIVVVTVRECRGYNWGIRLGHLITCIYPGNGADRVQMEGRIARVGQERPVVCYTYIYPKGSILQLLHERHSHVDNINTSLQHLARQYDKETLLQMLRSS